MLNLDVDTKVFDRFFSALVCYGERACTNSVKNTLRKTRFVIFKAYLNPKLCMKKKMYEKCFSSNAS